MKAVYRVNGERTYDPTAIKIIQLAPGFDGSGTYDLMETKSNGIRVYKMVGGRPMDASLRDVESSIFSQEIHDILGRRR